ncbi:MAG: zinc ribbon domain-containing protein [Deltaproteobacteria bacterium]|nr:zinc ribbon domain-containing protein [Deltaproteobacteria bacterium]
MPNYEFLCQKCAKVFELTFSITEYKRMKKESIKCPDCGSLKVARQISDFQVKTSKKS